MALSEEVVDGSVWARGRVRVAEGRRDVGLGQGVVDLGPEEKGKVLGPEARR